MRFNSRRVGDLGSREENVTSFDVSLVGKNGGRTKDLLVEEIKRRKLKVIGVPSVTKMKDGLWSVSVRVSSDRGII